MPRNVLNSGCPWCGRNAPACWVMPCLMLETALANENDRQLAKWCKSAGVKLQSKSTGKVVG